MVSRNVLNYSALHQLHGPISCSRGLHAHLGLNVSKKSTLLSWFYMPRTSLVIGSLKMKAIASCECEFPCEEEVTESKDESNQRDKAGFEADFAEPILPPWGNSDNIEDPEYDFEPSALESDQPKIVPQVKVSNVHFLEETDEETLSKRILALSRTNKPRSAMELLGSMELSGLRPDPHACNSLLSCLSRNGLIEDATRVFEFMKRKKLTTAHSFSLILKGVAGARGAGPALEMFVRMEKEEEEKIVNGFDSVVYNTMISACGRANDWAGALRCWRSMGESRVSGTRVTYSVLVCTFVRCGRDELALEAYAEMLRAGLEPGSDAMQAAIGASAGEGKWELGLGVFREMLRRGLEPSAVACNALINSLGRAGEVRAASGVFEAMRALGHSPDSYTWNAVLGALCRAGRHEEALRVLGRVSPSLHLYNTALVSCSKLGRWDRALQLMWRMEGDGMVPSTESYNLVIGACETARKPDVALRVYDRMARRNCEPDTFTHLLMIRVCIWGSLWDVVEQILNSASSDASLYNAAIQGMSLRGKVKWAKKLYSEMRNLGLQPDGKTRALMLQNLRQSSIRHKYRQEQPSRRRRTRTTLSSLSL